MILPAYCYPKYPVFEQRRKKEDYLKVFSLGLGLSLGLWLIGFVILGEYFVSLRGNRELWKQPLHVSLRTILSNVGVGSSMLVVLLGTSHDFAVKKKISQIRDQSLRKRSKFKINWEKKLMKIEEKYLKLKDSAPTEELPKIPEKLRTKLKEAQSRYEHLIGIRCGEFEKVEIEEDRQKYSHLLLI